mmetsp:Transcript_50087/g.119167  ORF Transcript_50087/g.119167 Transcript_50087/m.119167 type:complete len:285 (+) Transcript_50087:80-934(+)
MVGPVGLPVLKLFGLLAKQVSKPVASRLVSTAKAFPRMRGQMIGLGQFLHWASVRILRISDGHTADEKVVVRTLSYYTNASLKAEASEGDSGSVGTGEPRPAGKLARGQTVFHVKTGSGPLGPEVPMTLVEWWKGGDKHEAWVKSHLKDGIDALKPVGTAVKPLQQDEALDRGATFLGEGFVFAVAGAVALEEYLRKVASDTKAKAQIEAQREQKRARKEAQKAAEAANRDEQIRNLQLQVQRADVALLRVQQDTQKALVSLSILTALSIVTSGYVASRGVSLR